MLITPLAHCIADAELRVIDPDGAYLDLCGVRRHEALGRSALDWMHPDDRAPARAALRRLLRTGQGFEMLRRYCRPDGSTVLGRTRVVRVAGPRGEPHLIATCTRLDREDVAGAADGARRLLGFARGGRASFGDAVSAPALELLLLLYLAEAEGRVATLRALDPQLPYPCAVRLRWLRALAGLHLVEAEVDAPLAEDTPLRLTRHGWSRMERLLAALPD